MQYQADMHKVLVTSSYCNNNDKCLGKISNKKCKSLKAPRHPGNAADMH